MKITFAILIFSLWHIICRGQFNNDTAFLNKTYKLVISYSSWNDGTSETVEEVSGSGPYFFFDTRIASRPDDTLKVSGSLRTIYEIINPITEKKEISFPSCNPFLEMKKLAGDSCWRGRYASESTGICNAIMTENNGFLRISGMSNETPFVFFFVYKIEVVSNEIMTKISSYIGQ